MHSVKLFVLNKSKAQCRNVEPIFGFFISKILGRNVGQNLPSVLFWEKKKKKIIQTSFSKRLHSAPHIHNPVSSKIPAALLPPLPAQPLHATHCPALPIAKPDACSEGPVLIRIPTDLHFPTFTEMCCNVMFRGKWFMDDPLDK